MNQMLVNDGNRILRTESKLRPTLRLELDGMGNPILADAHHPRRTVCAIEPRVLQGMIEGGVLTDLVTTLWHVARTEYAAGRDAGHASLQTLARAVA